MSWINLGKSCQHVRFQKKCAGCRWYKRVVVPQLLKRLSR